MKRSSAFVTLLVAISLAAMSASAQDKLVMGYIGIT